MDVYDVPQCVTCQETSRESLSKVNEGVTTLIKFSKQWNNDKLVKYLSFHSFIHLFHFISKKSTIIDLKKNKQNAIIITNNYIIT